MKDRRRTEERKSFTVENIWNSHQEIMRLAVTGMKQADIARELGVSEVMVSYTLNSPVVKRQMMVMQAARDVDAVDVAKRIQEVAPKALDVLEELLETGNDTIRLRTATDLLDRAGHAAVKTFRTQSLSVHLDKEDLDEIKQRAREIGLCIDVDSLPSTA